MRAQLLATLSVSRVLQELPGGDEASEQAAAMATRVDDVAALLCAYHSRQLALSGPDDTEDRLELGQRMLDLGEARVSTRRWCGAISGGSTRCSSSDG